MNQRILIALLALAAVCCMGAAAADSDSDAASDISVTAISLDPATLMPGDTGFLTVEITNSGDESVGIDRAKLYTNDLSVVNDNAYDIVGDIGAGNSMEFTFTLKTKAADGIFYPTFYLDFSSAGSLRHSIPVIVDDTEPQISILNIPETFVQGKTEDLTVLVGNPREGDISGVTITPIGENLKSDQTSYFIGNLAQDESAEVAFAITPIDEGDLTFAVTYQTGVNKHSTTISIPIEFGTDKTSPDMVINDVSISSSGGTSTVTGDVTNAGLEEAYSVTVTVGSPATAANPNPVSVIGALEADDFSGFEVTYTMKSGGEVPVVVSYKDEDGNIYQETFYVSAASAAGAVASDGSSDASSTTTANGEFPGDRMGPGGQGGPGGNMLGSFGSGFASIPVIPIILGIILVAGGLVAWRKGYLAKARDTVRARLHKEK